MKQRTGIFSIPARFFLPKQCQSAADHPHQNPVLKHLQGAPRNTHRHARAIFALQLRKRWFAHTHSRSFTLIHAHSTKFNLIHANSRECALPHRIGKRQRLPLVYCRAAHSMALILATHNIMYLPFCITNQGIKNENQ